MTDNKIALRELLGKGSDASFLRAVQRSRYMILETIAPLIDDPRVSLPALAA